MDVLSRPAEEFENDQSLEAMWASKAFEHAEVYFDILQSVDPKLLHLTPFDEAIYKIFREDFPILNVADMDEDDMKSVKGKAKWRAFCERFSKVDDYNYGTLLRVNCRKSYNQENSMLVTRIQFLAIEIARNREGLNDDIRKNYHVTEAKEES